MTARFILIVALVLGVFLWTSWPLVVETVVEAIIDYIRRVDVRQDLGSFDD